MSILSDIKTVNNVPETVNHFDASLILFTNAALMNVTQLGVGPSTGFFISGDTESWDDLFGGRTDLEAVRVYVGLKVRMQFDPPQNSYLLEAMKQQAIEMEWRIAETVSPKEVI